MANRGRRRGANAVEFALVSPILLMLLGGTIDYGWYFWREALLINGLREAVRSGSLQQPGSNEVGGCASCVAAATSAVNSELGQQGYGISLNATLQRIPASGTPCSYAVVVDAEIPHQRIMTLVPGPDQISVRVLSMAQNVSCP